MTDSGVVTGRQQPQTTIEPPGGPFIRHSQPGRRPQYDIPGIQFGGLVSQPLASVPGYLRGYRLKFKATGGAGSSVAGNADAPFNCVSLVTLKDSFGNPLIVGPGYEILNLLPMFSGQFGIGPTRDVKNLASYSAIAAGTGNFTFSTYLPLEFAKAYGVISGANASLLPTLTLNMAPSSGVYSTLPTTVPTIELVNDSDFYWLPEGVAIQPPGLGTTCQWVYQQANPTFGANSTTTVQLPRLGGYLTELIFILRDSTGARVDAWPQRFRLLVDGVPLIDSDITEIYDDMQITYDGLTRPTGVIAISRKTSLAQNQQGLFDTGETYLSTNPGTLIEVQGAPWGSGGTAPYTLSCLVGQVVPAGTLIQGLPEV
ncbi:hypothetical protein [Kitasatospora sp. NPDC057198]|uniref:hypothetical protein n=1 Tax=Kitasatospora sp. NPDC057198 TaxID=3346046 RepID=UPI00362F6BFE